MSAAPDPQQAPEPAPSRPPHTTAGIVVIGGGLAGLTAALHLAERGLRVTILEADPERLGGRAMGGPPAYVPAGTGADPYPFASEHGIHGIWGQYHNLRGMLDRLGIDPGYRPARREAWVLRTRAGRIQWAEGGSALRRSWVPAPFHYLALFIRPRFLQMLTLRDLASMFRVFGGLLFALAYDPAAEGAPLRGRTLADFFRGWSPSLQALFVGLARNFASEAPASVPESGFIAFLRFYTLLRRDAWAFSYFEYDAGRALIAPLAERLAALGVTVRLGVRATALHPPVPGESDTWQIPLTGSTDATSSASRVPIEADQVVLATDAPGARAILENSPALADKLGGLHWPQAVPTAVLRYWFREAPRLMAEAGIFTGAFTLDNFFWLHCFQTDFARWHAQTGGTAVECHIYGPPELLQEPDAVLLARGVQDLTRAWPALRGALIHQTIRRNPPTHTLFDSDGEQLSVETPWPRLAACGDWVRYAHPSLYLERAVVTGIAAANRILADYSQPASPILSATPPEPLARLIEAGLRRVRARARARKQARRQAAGVSLPDVEPIE